jgi:hypothetical protein
MMPRLLERKALERPGVLLLCGFLELSPAGKISILPKNAATPFPSSIP